MQARRYAADGLRVVLIGHAGHEEVVGTMGEAPEAIVARRDASPTPRRSTLPDDAPLAYITQTTLSVDETAEIIDVLKRRFPQIRGPQREDICYATSNRQWAVKELLARDRPPARDRLAQLLELEPARRGRARRPDVDAHLIDDETEIDERWLERRRDRRPDVGRVCTRAARRPRLRLVPRPWRHRHHAVRVGVRGRRLPAARRAAPSRDVRRVDRRRPRSRRIGWPASPNRIERLPEQYFTALLGARRRGCRAGRRAADRPRPRQPRDRPARARRPRAGRLRRASRRARLRAVLGIAGAEGSDCGALPRGVRRARSIRRARSPCSRDEDRPDGVRTLRGRDVAARSSFPIPAIPTTSLPSRLRARSTCSAFRASTQAQTRCT